MQVQQIQDDVDVVHNIQRQHQRSSTEAPTFPSLSQNFQTENKGKNVLKALRVAMVWLRQHGQYDKHMCAWK